VSDRPARKERRINSSRKRVGEDEEQILRSKSQEEQ
jgi:hypothetical protein